MSETQKPFDDPEVQAKIQKVREKLGLTAPEAEAEPQAPAGEGEPVMTEESIDWSQFDLEPGVAHLYPRAKLVDTPEGPKWVTQIEVFHFITDSYKKLGARVTEAVNGPEQWKMIAVYGNGAGMGTVAFARMTKIILPDPVMLKTDAELPPPPTDAELDQAEEAAMKWMEQEGVKIEESEPLVVVSTEGAAEGVDTPPQV